MSNCLITGNSTADDGSHGGAIRAASVVVLDSVVSDNFTLRDGSAGGAISAGFVTVKDSQFSNNSAQRDGAHGGALVTVHRSRISIGAGRPLR